MRRIIVLATGILGGWMPLPAQTAPPDPTATFDDTIVVSASLEPEEREDLPASVTVIDAQEIADRQATTLAETIATVPGVTVVHAGSAGQQASLFVRGAESEQTLLLWNGIPLNDPFFGGANWQFVPTDGVERVEVARGPFSALWGGNALGGVVQVITRAQQGGRATLEAGGDGYLRGGIAAGWERGRARWDLIGHVRRGDGELPNDFFDSEEALARAEWTVRPGVTVGLLARANDSDTGIPLSGGQPTSNRRIAWEERELAVPFAAELGRWGIEAQVSQVWFDGAFRDPDEPFGFVASDTGSEAVRGRAVATYRVRSGFWIAAGAEAERFEVSNGSNFGQSLDGAHQRTWAVFTQTGWERGPIHVDLGVRRDENDVYGGETSLRTGVAVDLGRGTRVMASYGEAFRAPSIGELFFPGSGNPALAPERGEVWELGVEREAGPWRLALTGFDGRQLDLVDFDFVDFRNVNLGRTRSRGVEAEVGFRRGLVAVRANGTWLDAEDRETGDELLRRPRETANLLVTLSPGDWRLNLEGRYMGRRADVDPVTFARSGSPSFATLDLAARWEALSWLSPYARLENATDESYAEVLGFPAPGRRLVGGVAVDF